MQNKLAQFPELNDTSQQIQGLVVASVQGVSPEGYPLVQWQGGAEPCVTQTVWMEHEQDWFACVGKRVIVGFENGHATQPILLGLLDKPTRPDENANRRPVEAEVKEAEIPEMLRIESKHELVLECGKAKISLRADGRIIILGGYLVSRSTGVNKIKGGSVQIN